MLELFGCCFHCCHRSCCCCYYYYYLSFATFPLYRLIQFKTNYIINNLWKCYSTLQGVTAVICLKWVECLLYSHAMIIIGGELIQRYIGGLHVQKTRHKHIEYIQHIQTTHTTPTSWTNRWEFVRFPSSSSSSPSKMDYIFFLAFNKCCCAIFISFFAWHKHTRYTHFSQNVGNLEVSSNIKTQKSISIQTSISITISK